MLSQLGGDACDDGQVAHRAHEAAEGVVQDGGAGAPVLEDALDRDGRGGVRVQVGGQLGADEDEGGVGDQVKEAADVHGGVAHAA